VHVRGYPVHSSRQPYGVSATMEAAKLIDWANRANAENAAATPTPEAAPFDPPFTTINVGRISGGTAHNITAQDCWFDFTFRVVAGEDPEDWAARAAAEAARIAAGMQAVRPETGITLDRIFRLPALRPEEGGAAEALVRRLTGENARHVVSYGTEGGQFQARGWSVVVCGPGDIAQAHQPDEFVTLEQFAAAEAFLDRLLDELCAP
jgi:acetylornithine deacetylase